jgi:hypothetical protein
VGSVAAQLLERFLTTTRFAELRADHPGLSGATRRRLRIAEQPDSKLTWELLPPR